MKIAEGTKLGRYEIRSLIGVGGMGEVYLARDPKIGRDVAIKVLPAALTWLEKDVEDRSSYAIGYAVDPLLDDVRNDPRFKAMLKRMNLPE